MNNENNNINNNQQPTDLSSLYGVNTNSAPAQQPVMTPVEDNIQQPVMNQPEIISQSANDPQPTVQPMITPQPEIVSTDNTITADTISQNPSVAPVENNLNNVTPKVDATDGDKSGNFLSINIDPNDEDLYRAYVGKNYDSFLNSKFNVGAFFFNIIYFFYRKMFLYGLTIWAINTMIIIFTGQSLFGIAISVIFGIVTNKVYFAFVGKKINKIKTDNPGATREMLLELCTKKGGTSVGGVFLGILIEIITLIAIVVLLVAQMALSLISAFTNFDVNSINNGKFNGLLLTDTSVKIREEFTINPPSIFKDSSDESEYNYYYENTTGVFNQCKFTLNAVNGNSNVEEFATEMSEYYNGSTVENQTINGIIWYHFNADGTTGPTHYYLTSKNDKPYILTYEIQQDAPSDCSSHEAEVLNSIQNK